MDLTIIVVALLVLVPLGIWLSENTPEKVRQRQEYERRTQTVKGWIICADQGLRDGSNKIGGPVKVVFTLDKSADSLDERLKSLAASLVPAGGSFHAQRDDFGKSEAVSSALSNGLKTFTTMVWVSPDHLPGGILTKPFIMVKVCASDDLEPMGGASMTRQE